jgi:hypothetical protein
VKPADLPAEGLQLGPCTLYRQNLGPASRVECRSLRIMTKRFAQYEGAIEFVLLAKGQRAHRVCYLTNHVWAVVLDGHGHPNAPSMYGETDASGVRTSRHLMCAPEWAREADGLIARVLAAKPAALLFDARGYEATDTVRSAS